MSEIINKPDMMSQMFGECFISVNNRGLSELTRRGFCVGVHGCAKGAREHVNNLRVKTKETAAYTGNFL